jgi:hypothetical protein
MFNMFHTARKILVMCAESVEDKYQFIIGRIYSLPSLEGGTPSTRLQ